MFARNTTTRIAALVALAALPVASSQATVFVTLEPAFSEIEPGGSITFEVFLRADPPQAVRGYQLTLLCAANACSEEVGALDYMPPPVIDTTRFDYIFPPDIIFIPVIDSGICPSGDPRIAATTLFASDAVTVGDKPVYLGEATYVASADANGVFIVRVLSESPDVVTAPATVGVGMPPELRLVTSDPPDGAIDARQPNNIDGSNPTGWSTVQLTFNEDVAGLTPEDFTVTLDPPGPPPFLAFVFVDGNTATLQFGDFAEDPFPPGHWTNITHNETSCSVRLGYLPGDVDGDGTSGPSDILALIDHLHGVVELPDHATDINRSGLPTAADILRVIDLLNGAGAFDVWNGVSLP